MDVSNWQQADSSRVAPRVPSISNRSWTRSIGLIGTLILHLALIQTVMLGSRIHKVQPPETQGSNATLVKSHSEPTEPLILLQLTGIQARNQSLTDDLASVGSAPKNPIVTMISPDPLPHIDVAQDEMGDTSDPIATIDSGDPAARAALFGRYTGQIDARIERVWKRPRSPVNPTDESRPGLSATSARAHDDVSNSFRCQVRIIQDHRGAVQEVQVIDCNGIGEWQQSLVRAIFSASPLPAPPSATVFTHALNMTFEGHGYTATSVVDDYEAAVR